MDELILVGLDRDGTINFDPGYYGKDSNWKEQFKFYPGIVEGIYLINENPNTITVVASNQAGVARGFYSIERVKEINNFIDEKLMKGRAIISDWQTCPYVSLEYAKKKEMEPNEWVKNSELRKPGIGMLVNSVKKFGFRLEEFTKIFFLGNKLSDVETGLNANGVGILIKTGEYESSYEKTLELSKKFPDRVYIAENFLHAAEIVLTQK